MVHSSRTYKYASYEEFRDNGMFSSEANCMQFLLDMKILRTYQKCPTCHTYMELKKCAITSFREGCCWKCPCGKTTAPKTGSVLQNSNITYEEFIKILAAFSEGKSVKSAAQRGNLAENTVRRFFNKIHEQIAEDVTTKIKIGGVGTVVELDESKFGKRKYHRGRMVEGTWVLGGIQRETNHCFLIPCPGNKRDESTLVAIIQKFVLPGTTIITDGWKAYVNLGNYGYVHADVNHSVNFVNPVTGGHTNLIEGTWTHAKYKAFRRGGRKTEDSLMNDLSEFMWRRQKGLSASESDPARQIFSHELPSLLNYKKFAS